MTFRKVSEKEYQGSFSRWVTNKIRQLGKKVVKRVLSDSKPSWLYPEEGQQKGKDVSDKSTVIPQQPPAVFDAAPQPMINKARRSSSTEPSLHPTLGPQTSTGPSRSRSNSHS